MPAETRMPFGELRRLIDGRLFATFFQPIVDVGSQEIFGHEALARGPATSQWHSPLEFFACAEEQHLTVELDLLLLELAIERFVESAARGRLFLNVMPATLLATRELTARLEAVLTRRGLAASEIVLEITE